LAVALRTTLLDPDLQRLASRVGHAFVMLVTKKVAPSAC
jgi:hypothetical protein